MLNLDNLTIVELTAENVKKLVAVQIKPDGSLVQITGRNGQGKTSVLDCIWWALEGAKHIQAEPIRKGAKEARIRLDLGVIKVTRTFRRPKDETGQITTFMSIENEDGAKFPKPQMILDQLFGALTFDPMAFLREEPKKQLTILRGFVSDVDFDAIDCANKADLAKRTEVNRDAKMARAQAAGIVVPMDKPVEPVDEEALIRELEDAGEIGAGIERERASREAVMRDLVNMRLDVQRAHNRAHAIREKARTMIEEAEREEHYVSETEAVIKSEEDRVAALPALREPVDTSDVRRRLAEAKEVNRIVTLRAQRAAIEERALALEAQADTLTEAINDRRAQVTEAIAKAQMPVPGMSFGDDMVLLNDLPLNQASDAEQLRTAVAVAMAMNPKLRVIRIRDGSLLDPDGLKLLAEMAQERGYQIWIERVDTSGKAGFVIEDGTVKSRPEAA